MHNKRLGEAELGNHSFKKSVTHANEKKRRSYFNSCIKNKHSCFATHTILSIKKIKQGKIDQHNCTICTSLHCFVLTYLNLLNSL